MSADRTNSLRWRDIPLVLLALLIILPATPFVVLWLAARTAFYEIVLIFVWLRWLPQGRDTLVIYSRSPYWQDFFEQKLLPRISSRSYIMDWSERKQWEKWSLQKLVFDGFSGHENFNPMVIVFSAWKRPRRFRMFRAFRDLKHRNKASINAVIDQLNDCLGESIPYPPLPPKAAN